MKTNDKAVTKENPLGFSMLQLYQQGFFVSGRSGPSTLLDRGVCGLGEEYSGVSTRVKGPLWEV